MGSQTSTGRHTPLVDLDDDGQPLSEETPVPDRDAAPLVLPRRSSGLRTHRGDFGQDEDKLMLIRATPLSASRFSNRSGSNRHRHCCEYCRARACRMSSGQRDIVMSHQYINRESTNNNDSRGAEEVMTSDGFEKKGEDANERSVRKAECKKKPEDEEKTSEQRRHETSSSTGYVATREEEEEEEAPTAITDPTVVAQGGGQVLQNAGEAAGGVQTPPLYQQGEKDMKVSTKPTEDPTAGAGEQGTTATAATAAATKPTAAAAAAKPTATATGTVGDESNNDASGGRAGGVREEEEESERLPLPTQQSGGDQTAHRKEKEKGEEEEKEEEELVPCVFTWTHGGHSVYLTGSFNAWSLTNKIRLNRSGHEFSYIQNLPRGVHFYKFIVDDEWRFAPDQRTQSDQHGNINNVLDISHFTRFDFALPSEIEEAREGPYHQLVPEPSEYSTDAPTIPILFGKSLFMYTNLPSGVDVHVLLLLLRPKGLPTEEEGQIFSEASTFTTRATTPEHFLMSASLSGIMRMHSQTHRLSPGDAYPYTASQIISSTTPMPREYSGRIRRASPPLIAGSLQRWAPLLLARAAGDDDSAPASATEELESCAAAEAAAAAAAGVEVHANPLAHMLVYTRGDARREAGRSGDSIKTRVKSS